MNKVILKYSNTYSYTYKKLHYKNYQKLSMAEPILKAMSEVKIFLGYDAANDRAELENMFHQVDEFLIPTFQYARTRGDNMGPFAVWTYVARMQNPQSTQ